jgi:RNA polymerase sigma-70 factor (ECF subfamily)
MAMPAYSGQPDSLRRFLRVSGRSIFGGFKMAANERTAQQPQQGIPCRSAAEQEDEFLQATVRYRAQFIWVVRRMTGCNDEAEDIVQIAFMKAYKNLHRFRGEARMTTWLRAIVQNAAREYVRNYKGRVVLSLEYDRDQDGESLVMDFPDPALNPEESCARREVGELLGREVNRLSTYSRRAIQLCILDELPHAEAAKSLDVTVSSMKSRIFRGKRHLHRALCNRIGAAG